MSFTVIYLVLISAVTFVLYGYDKMASVNRWSRIPEGALHLLAIFGGTPGAYMGQRFFRHKTRKESFQAIFWLTVFVQSVALLLWLLSRGRW